MSLGRLQCYCWSWDGIREKPYIVWVYLYTHPSQWLYTVDTVLRLLLFIYFTLMLKWWIKKMTTDVKFGQHDINTQQHSPTAAVLLSLAVTEDASECLLFRNRFHSWTHDQWQPVSSTTLDAIFHRLAVTLWTHTHTANKLQYLF